MKKVYWVVILAAISLFGCQSVPAGNVTEEPIVKVSEGAEAIKIGNNICPVCEGEIEAGKEDAYEYEGKIYNFCRADCVEEFKKDPQKYIEIVEKELKAEAEKKYLQQREEMMKEPEPVSSYHQEHL